MPPIAVQLRTDFRGAAAPLLRKWLIDEVRALSDVVLVDRAAQFTLFAAGGLMRIDGFEEPTLAINAVFTTSWGVADDAVAREALSAEALQMLDAPGFNYFMFDGGPPVAARLCCRRVAQAFEREVLAPERARAVKRGEA